MSVTFQKEPLEPAFWEAQELFRAHWDEIAEMKDVNVLDPDVDEYRALAKSGRLHILTARDEGKLVGYYAAFIKNNLHYKSVIVGSDDLYFIHPAYRRGGVGVRLLLAAERMQREAGAVIAVLKEKLSHPHAALFERLGYKPMERVLWKKLDGEAAVPAIASEGAC